jgi:carbon monoxide dehydrogenase subunit G
VKLHEEFEVARPVAAVWAFLDRPDAVAACVPGVEQLTVQTPDDIDVRISQSVGPMTATFAASVRITDREPEHSIAFTAVGKSVRGAAGNVRAEMLVSLRPGSTGSIVAVEGDVALAGALGSVGQKVVAKQAGKVTALFARNLEAALGGATVTSIDGPAERRTTAPSRAVLPPVGDPALAGSTTGRDPWVKALVALSAAQVLLAAVSLTRGRRGKR